MVKIDKEKCIGCGSCEAICPAGFEVVGDKAKVKDVNAPCIKEAVTACPQGAIVT